MHEELDLVLQDYGIPVIVGARTVVLCVPDYSTEIDAKYRMEVTMLRTTVSNALNIDMRALVQIDSVSYRVTKKQVMVDGKTCAIYVEKV